MLFDSFDTTTYECIICLGFTNLITIFPSNLREFASYLPILIPAYRVTLYHCVGTWYSYLAKLRNWLEAVKRTRKLSKPQAVARLYRRKCLLWKIVPLCIQFLVQVSYQVSSQVEQGLKTVLKNYAAFKPGIKLNYKSLWCVLVNCSKLVSLFFPTSTSQRKGIKFPTLVWAH